MWRAALICVLLAVPVGADTPTRVQDAFQGWLNERDGKGALAIWRAGKEVAVTAHGLDPATRHEMASLSKAITATCAMTLVEEGRWTLETTAADVLGTGDVTLGALITHTAGLWPDATQGLRESVLPLARSRAPRRGGQALARGVDGERAGAFWYNNENYAVLGDMIAAETGQSYEDACRARVLAPAGVDGVPSAQVGPMLAWGGWTLTVSDYAAFHHHWYAAAGRDPLAGPRHAFEGAGYFYGAGMFVRPWGQSQNVWHFGGHCFPAQLNSGSFAASYARDWAVVLAHDLCLEWDDMLALDQVLVGALFGAGE
ncbi:MAG: serine hydrolase domain-containing protein [Pseudomonadota bacterium]